MEVQPLRSIEATNDDITRSSEHVKGGLQNESVWQAMPRSVLWAPQFLIDEFTHPGRLPLARGFSGKRVHTGESERLNVAHLPMLVTQNGSIVITRPEHTVLALSAAGRP